MVRKIIFKDKAGNFIESRFLKTKGTLQLIPKNKQGRILSPSEGKKLIKKAKII